MKPLSRRAFLQGTGAIISLPFLEAMLPLRAYAAVGDTRFIAMYFPIGIHGSRMNTHHMDAWRPAAPGNLMSFPTPTILEPLSAYKNDFSIVSGLKLARESQSGDGEHAAAAAMFLTCRQPPDFRNSDRHFDSVDQLIGRHLQSVSNHQFSSIVVSPNRKTGADGFGATNWVPGFSGNISYFNNTRVSKHTNPIVLFDLLFPNAMAGGTSPAPNDTAAKLRLYRQKKSILDGAIADANRLKARLGASDRAQLEQYFEGVREAERQIASLMTAPQPTPTQTMTLERPGADTHNANDDFSSNNSNYGLRTRTFINLIVLGLQLNKAPVATMMLDSENSTDETQETRVYAPVADFPSYNGITRENMTSRHHDLSHGGDIDHRLAINRYQSGFFAYLLGRLKAVSEPGGTLLDKTMAVYGCGIRESKEHDHSNLPILLAGRGGGLNPGRNIFAAADPNNVGTNLPLANLYLALMQKAGMNVSSFADSSGPLGNL